MPKTMLAVLIFCFAFTGKAFAWGCEGHRIVALVAWNLLQDNAHARQRIEQVLTKLSKPTTGCSIPQGMLPIASASTWADAVRNNANAPWHFIDIPVAADFPAASEGQFCSAGCVTKKIREFRDKLLHSPNTTKKAQAEALAFLIHFSGDVHQPLHAATNNDRGGNCVPVNFLGNTPDESGDSGKYTPELHGVWDKDLVTKAQAGKTRDQFASDLAALARQHSEWASADPLAWATESHRLARNPAYDGLTFVAQSGNPPLLDLMRNPSEPSSCHAVAAKEAFIAETLKVSIESGYATTAGGLIKEQLAKGGLRLAGMLAQIWPAH